MTKHHCYATNCNSSSAKQQNLVKYAWMKSINFHCFPTVKSKKMRKLWIDMVRIESWQPTRHSRLCSMHFVGFKGPTKCHPIPTLFDYNAYGGMLKGKKRTLPSRHRESCGPDSCPAKLEASDHPQVPHAENIITPHYLVPMPAEEVTLSSGELFP